MYVPNANSTELKQKAIAPKVQKQLPKNNQMCPKPTAQTCTKSDCTKSVQKTIAKKQMLSKCAPKLPAQNLTKSDCTRYKLLPPPPATKGGVPQTVIGPAKPITKTQEKEGKPGNGQ
jgi:hypothetical protein